MKFDEVKIKLQEGDTITSRKGFISKSPISNQWFIYKEAKYNGNGCFIVIGDKQEVKVTISKKKEVVKTQ